MGLVNDHDHRMWVMIAAELFGDPDFIGVRAALIREVGAVEAIVLTRIHFRAAESYRHAYEQDGYWWWRAPAPTIAEETGLTEKQVKRALTVLREQGHIVAEQHATEGRYDRAMSVRVNLVPTGTVDRPHRDDEDRPYRDDVPSSVKKREEGGEDQDHYAIDEQFDGLWEAWPKKTEKRAARLRWARLSKTKRNEILPLLIAHANGYRATTPIEYVPNLASFLLKERWSETPKGVSAEDVKPRGFVVPAGHVPIIDEASGRIVGSRPA